MAENAACGSDVGAFDGDDICKVCAHPAREHASWRRVGGRSERQAYTIAPDDPDAPTSIEYLVAQGKREQADAWKTTLQDLGEVLERWPGRKEMADAVLSGVDQPDGQAGNPCVFCGRPNCNTSHDFTGDPRAWKTAGAPDERRAYVPTTTEDLNAARAAYVARADARKDDAGKPRWSLLLRDFRPALEAIIKIREHGNAKYGREDSWKDVPDGEARYVEALVRHVIAYAGGEDLDPDSGEPHLAHAGINVLFLLWYRAKRLAQGG